MNKEQTLTRMHEWNENYTSENKQTHIYMHEQMKTEGRW